VWYVSLAACIDELVGHRLWCVSVFAICWREVLVHRIALQYYYLSQSRRWVSGLIRTNEPVGVVGSTLMCDCLEERTIGAGGCREISMHKDSVQCGMTVSIRMHPRLLQTNQRFGVVSLTLMCGFLKIGFRWMKKSWCTESQKTRSKHNMKLSIPFKGLLLLRVSYVGWGKYIASVSCVCSIRVCCLIWNPYSFLIPLH